MGRLALAALVFVAWACVSQETALAPTPRGGAASPEPTREPRDLVRYPEETAVLGALTRTGMHIDLIGGSKFETILGAPRRARVFIGTIGIDRVGVDVLFLDEPAGDVRVCTSTGSAPGFTKAAITVNGQLASSGEGSQILYFALGDRYFVVSSDPRVRQNLFKELGLRVPSC